MKKLLSVILCTALLACAVPSAHAVEYNLMEPVTKILAAGENRMEADAFYASYENNLFISLRDTAQVLSGTEAQFNLEFSSTQSDGDNFALTTGMPYAPVEKTKDESGEPFSLNLYRNRIFIDGSERKYYSYRYGTPDDLFMNPVDIALLLNIRLEQNAGELRFYPGEPFTAELGELQAGGWFEPLNGVLLGNAVTGEVEFASKQNTPYPVASTSKLMTYLLIAEAIARGELHTDEIVYVSERVQKLSEAEDGMIKMKAGQAVPVSELITAMLLASSNESALALAERVGGSEENFTAMMNARARELGLGTAVFYNASGLPQLTGSVFSAKCQNTMSAADLFTLASYVLRSFPEITSITSQLYARMESLDYTTANSNPLVFNGEGVTGLKTGSTKASGNCVVACTADGRIAIVLGAEDAALRGRVAEVLLRGTIGGKIKL